MAQPKVSNNLKASGLRPTKQRLALAKLLFESDEQHFTAEGLFHVARKNGIMISLSTVYNTLHQFTEVGLLREVVVDGEQSYFDTSPSQLATQLREANAEIARLKGEADGEELEQLVEYVLSDIAAAILDSPENHLNYVRERLSADQGNQAKAKS